MGHDVLYNIILRQTEPVGDNRADGDTILIMHNNSAATGDRLAPPITYLPAGGATDLILETLSTLGSSQWIRVTSPHTLTGHSWAMSSPKSLRSP